VQVWPPTATAPPLNRCNPGQFPGSAAAQYSRLCHERPKVAEFDRDIITTICIDGSIRNCQSGKLPGFRVIKNTAKALIRRFAENNKETGLQVNAGERCRIRIDFRCLNES
jgi:hypothetical protein